MGKDLKGKELGTGLRQKSNGTYSARFVDRFGQRQELYDKNLAELKRKLNTAIYDDANGNNVVENSITLSKWFEEWMEIHKYKVIRNNTKVHYQQIFTKHIKPTLGRKKEEQTEFFDCCKGTFYDNLFVAAISTGLRQGELCALTWDDIDLEKKEININKTLLYQKLEGDSGKTFHINPPKTKSSYRTVPINKQCELALKKQYVQRNNVMAKKSAKPLPGFENLLFVTKFGTPICDQIMIDAIKKILEEINLCKDELEQFEYFSPHCFRHSFATRCFEADIQPKTVQQFLGHAASQMTMDLYTHVLRNQKQEDMQKLEGVLEVVFEGSNSIVEERFLKEKCGENKVVNITKVG